MIRSFCIFLFVIHLPFQGNSKEWSCLKEYQKQTNQVTLQPQDWLKRDRLRKTVTWKNANAYNLTHNLPHEYETIKQHKDFYEWLDADLKAKGHEVLWPKMAYFISNKLRLLECFPYEMLANKKFIQYGHAGSNSVFINSFPMLKNLYESEIVLQGTAAVDWDKAILKEEQYDWIEKVYLQMDEKSITLMERVAAGRSFYGLFVPKKVRYKGDISKAEERYDFALNKLRVYCKTLD